MRFVVAGGGVDSELHDRIESTFAQLMTDGPPPPPGPPRDELLAALP